MKVEDAVFGVLKASGTIDVDKYLAGAGADARGLLEGGFLNALRDARAWSSGEVLLIETAEAVWREHGGPSIFALLSGLDGKTFAKVVRVLAGYLKHELVPAGIADDLAAELQTAVNGTLSLETARPVLAMYRGVRGLGVGHALAERPEVRGDPRGEADR